MYGSANTVTYKPTPRYGNTVTASTTGTANTATPQHTHGVSAQFTTTVYEHTETLTKGQNNEPAASSPPTENNADSPQ